MREFFKRHTTILKVISVVGTILGVSCVVILEIARKDHPLTIALHSMQKRERDITIHNISSAYNVVFLKDNTLLKQPLSVGGKSGFIVCDLRINHMPYLQSWITTSKSPGYEDVTPDFELTIKLNRWCWDLERTITANERIFKTKDSTTTGSTSITHAGSVSGSVEVKEHNGSLEPKPCIEPSINQKFDRAESYIDKEHWRKKLKARFKDQIDEDDEFTFPFHETPATTGLKYTLEGYANCESENSEDGYGSGYLFKNKEDDLVIDLAEKERLFVRGWCAKKLKEITQDPTLFPQTCK
ncbi:MAG: hypothetical protein WC045_01865 [Patescibacteria group bacterium]